MVTLRQVLQEVPGLQQARLVSGAESLDREIGWPQVVDIPGIADWLHQGDLLLTTAFVLHEPIFELRTLLETLHERGVVGAFVAVGRYLPHIPKAMREFAEQLHFPLVELPWQAPLTEIARQIARRIVLEHRELLAHSFDIHHALTQAAASGADLSTLADLLAHLLDCGVTIEDPELRILAAAHGPFTDTARQASLAYGHTPPVIKEYLRAHGFLNALAREPRATPVGPFPELGLHGVRIVAPIMADRELLGYIWVLVGHRPVTRLDYLGVEHAATVAALILTRERAIREALAHHRRDLLDFLFSDDSLIRKERHHLTSRLAQLGLKVDTPYRVFLARGDLIASHILSSIEAAWIDIAEQEGGGLVGRREGHVVLIADEGLAQRVLSWCQTFVHEHPEVLIGVGEPVPLINLSRSYNQAMEATEIHQRLGRTSGVVTFASLGIWHWVYHLPADLQSENMYLRKVRDLYRTHPGLIETLEAYLDSGANAVQTAKRLYLHRSTLLYRLRRLEHLLGISLADPLMRLNLHVAIKALRLERSTPAA